MVRVALPSYDIHTLNGRATGVGTFLYHFSKLLKANGDDVTLIATHHGDSSIKVDEPWRKIYESLGINLLYVHNDPYVWHCGNHLITLSRKLAPTLEKFDVAYFMDWGNVAFHTVRAKRFTSGKMPVCVTVTHAPSNWCRPSLRKYLEGTEDLHLDYMERYSAEHSDFVAAPSQAMLDFIRDDGWKFKRQPEVLGLPVFPAQASSEFKPAEKIKRLVFFGRVETRKNFDMFVKAILRLNEMAPEALTQIEEIVFLGEETEPGSLTWIREQLKPLRAKVIHLGHHDNVGANNYLAKVAGETLAVIPSMYENLTYAGIEASMVRGLNLICTNGGGTPEIFGGKGEKQLFEPSVQGLAAKMLERLNAPLTPDQLISYDYKAANDRWLEFHRRVCQQVDLPKTVIANPSIERTTLNQSGGCSNTNSDPPARDRRPGHSVDVCVTFYNKHKYFEQLLRSLENQTTSDFSVIAVDDGSPDPSAMKLFDSMAQKYASRGWTFFRQDNRFVDAARNEAARRSQAEYLFMLDADDLISPNAIERLLEAARLSGDDGLVTGSCWFKGDEYPLDAKTGQVTAPVEERLMPVGPNLSAALFDPWALGGSAIFIRRAAFEAVGGYRELRGVNHEDWELQLRLAFAGYRIDVVPEFLYLYRRTDDSLSQGADTYRASRRLIDTYNKKLAAAGIHNGGDIMFTLQKRCKDLENRLNSLAMQQSLAPRADSFEFSSSSPQEDSSSFNDELNRRFGPDDKGPPLIRQLRRIYRKQLSLNTRLELHGKLMELIGRR
jgi:GT2 family glycosyltransferase/glycosyltransferase involved in cell wall biosynthesis